MTNPIVTEAVARAMKPELFDGTPDEERGPVIRLERDFVRRMAERAILAMSEAAGSSLDRATAWLYAREGGVAFASLTEAQQKHWRDQAAGMLAAVGLGDAG